MGRESYNPQYNMIIASVKLDMLDAVNAQKFKKRHFLNLT